MQTHLRATAMRRPLSAVAVAIVIVAMSSALMAGCGGNKSSSSSENTNTGTSVAPENTNTATSAPESAGTSTAGFDPAATFKQKCAMCHGPEGRGNGPSAAALTPKPRNYHDQAYMSTRTDEQLYQSVFNGKSAMPAWGKTGVLTSDQVRAMVKYVRQLGSTP